MDKREQKIYQQHYSQFATVAQARQHGDHESLPLWIWVKDLPAQMPMYEAFQNAMNHKALSTQ